MSSNYTIDRNSNTSPYAPLRPAPGATTGLKVAILFLFIFFTSFSLSAQTNANQVLHGVYGKLQKAKDYSVQANIKVDMPFIRMLPIDATIYFKQKDKFKVESKSIAIVPRQGFDQASKMLSDTNSYTAVAQGTELIAGVLTTIINIIPLSDTSDLILGRLWIDTKQSLILKSQLTTKSNGTILTEYSYGTQAAFGLPDKMIFSVDIKKFKIPKGVATDMNNSADEKKKKENENKKGKIFITLTNYVVNKGIPDEKFKK
jgi:outer membrane lipoprotein-sorting protein